MAPLKGFSGVLLLNVEERNRLGGTPPQAVFSFHLKDRTRCLAFSPLPKRFIRQHAGPMDCARLVAAFSSEACREAFPSARDPQRASGRKAATRRTQSMLRRRSPLPGLRGSQLSSRLTAVDCARLVAAFSSEACRGAFPFARKPTIKQVDCAILTVPSSRRRIPPRGCNRPTEWHVFDTGQAL